MKCLAHLTKTYAIKYVNLPKTKATKSELNNALMYLSEALRKCPSKLCIAEMAKLLNADDKALRQLIAGHLLLFRNYYMIPAAIGTRAAADFINLKIREDPLPFFVLVIGLIKFSGIATNVLDINNYQLRYFAKRPLSKLRLSYELRREYAILPNLINSHIDMQVDVLLFLTTNYAVDYEAKSKGSITAIEMALFELATRTYTKENITAESAESNIEESKGQDHDTDDQESVSDIDEKDILQCQQDQQVSRDEVPLAAQGDA